MKAWTNQAEQRLTEYLGERVRREGFDGEEADELKSDLRSHIHEEAEKEKSEMVGLMQVEGILGRLDAGYRPPLPPADDSPAAEIIPDKGRRRAWLWIGAVIFPLCVSLFEIAVPFCGSMFFDPVATVWHALLVLSVPAINAWLLGGARRGSEKQKGLAAGFALVISAFYALLFALLLPASIFALILFGIGLLSLMPVFAGLATWRIGRMTAIQSLDLPRFRRGRMAGAGFAMIALLMLEGPSIWTRANMDAAMQEGSEKTAAISRLRSFHSERSLLRACYEGNRGTAMATDISGWIFRGWQVPAMVLDKRSNFRAPDSEKIRDVYFRVTGRSFNSVKPPRMVREGGFNARRNNAFREVEFDDHLGGDQVAVRLKDLDMAESRLDGHIDARSRLGYGEWTMVFKNRGFEAKEARCQVLLPRGGRVSRLTLWINGEPREAAFNSVSKVKAAYKEIAVVQRRDPVLVTMSGPDTVLVQCFPVPAQGEMKIRFGITAPLHDGLWELPRILERNFGTAEGLEHAVWLQGDGSFDLIDAGSPSKTATRDGDGHSMAVTLPPEAAMGRVVAVKENGQAAPVTVWCEDKFAPAFERYLIREPKPSRHAADANVLIVIDGSATMEEAKPWILEMLAKDFPAGSFRILMADDAAREISVKDFEALRFSGGRDNEPALREAVRRAKAGEAGEIVWLHGPQAAGLSQTEALLQLIERGTRKPVIYSVMVSAGPNRLAQALASSGALLRGPALIEPRKDLAAFLNLLRTEHEELSWHWKRSPVPPADLGNPVWDHLARQWAIDSVDSPLSGLPETDRPALAAKYQLVTRVSGAVVLETQEQYEKHGLTPVDANAAPQIPGVPEASTSLLVMISAAAALMRRRRPTSETDGDD